MSSSFVPKPWRVPKESKNLGFLVQAESNKSPPQPVYAPLKAILLPALLSFFITTISQAQSCREVVRDGSGRVVQTIDRQKQAGGSERAVIRDASGRVIDTATTRTAAGGSGQTTFRDANGRAAGSATTNGSSSGSSRTTYRDASGRTSGSATTSNFSGSGSRTQFRDASGRLEHLK